ncbi:hypothetical protein EJ06DRAFT_556604 [Trichodelitschia bisporula]|uniref:Methyltransferase domain-containing protein n=1 Tax=Trichodelitschia bisporula TaxID=703511 RepID=A0A6G1HWM3_9PEZI|nr:hypothetical protein EJ06DRAFT_556604 [Trichodelitschia bisporula]
MLTAQWTHRIPFLQQVSPAELAASLIIRTLDGIPNGDKDKLSVVDFCSGAGGPTPTIEAHVNARRIESNKESIPFLLTDIHPHIESWTSLCAKSEHLRFVPEPVDATDPPAAVISATACTNDSAAGIISGRRVFRLFCLSFHHFDDALARRVMESTLATADGIAIVELQTRDLGSLVLMLGFFGVIFVVTIMWFWGDWGQLALTYLFPAVPLVVVFDGLVSALRVRGFGEVMVLVGGKEVCVKKTVGSEGRRVQRAEVGKWVFEGGSEVHTWPLGYMSWVVGYKKG